MVMIMLGLRFRAAICTQLARGEPWACRVIAAVHRNPATQIRQRERSSAVASVSRAQ